MNKQIKVLHVITTMNRGGAENHLNALILQQLKQGLTVAVLYLKGDDYWAESLASQGVLVKNLTLKFYGDFLPVLKLRSFINSYQPDLVHAHMPPAELYVRLAMLISKSVKSFVITKHNDEPFYKGLGHYVLGRWVMKRASKVIAISESVNNYMSCNLGIPGHKLITIRYGIDLAPYLHVNKKSVQQLRFSWAEQGQLIIGTVARLVPQKALHVLIQSFARYQKLSDISSRLVIVGRGPLESDLRQLAHELGIEQQIIWVGFREDIPEVIASFDIFALTSAYEGFGLVLLEAMASKTCIVASKVSAIPEIIKDGLNGYLCDFGDEESFVEAFKSLENQHLRLNIGKTGFDLVRQEFTLSQMAQETLHVYESCLFGHAAKYR